MRWSRLDSFQLCGVLFLIILFAVPVAIWIGDVSEAGEITASTLSASLRDMIESLTVSQLASFVWPVWSALVGVSGGFVVSVWLIREEKRKRSRLRFQELSGLLVKTAYVGNDDLVPLARRILAAGDGSADHFFEAGGALHDQFRKLKVELSVEHLPTLRWRDGEIFDECGEERLQRLKPLLDDMRRQWPPNLGRINESLSCVLKSDASHRAK